jgi:hypothetical protein
MLAHADPDCTGTWVLAPPNKERAQLCCTRCAARLPATAEQSLAAVRENLLSIQLMVMGLAGRSC